MPTCTAPRARPDSQVAASLDQVEGHEVRRPLPRRLSGSCPAAGEPLLQLLERELSRSHATSSPSIAVPAGSCARAAARI
ncbi:hypothetical protein ACFYV5_31155 [Streptomyces sp. NPDC003035]|uniref:hypothetical protein n=1 Tax=Streptomyces sp. NPDC003035 TaxID=3364676 RepID=UPI0036BE8883